MCARLFHSNGLVLIFSWLLALAIVVPAARSTSRWYFLSGTPGITTKDTLRGFPSILYTVDQSNKKLRMVRQIASGADGVQSIRQYGNVIFVAYPVLPPRTLSVIHASDPAQVDTVLFNPRGLIVTDYWLALTEPEQASINELLLMNPNPGRSPQLTLISVAAIPRAGGNRVEKNVWGEYSSFRFCGIPGGPAVPTYLIGTIMGNELGVRFKDPERFITLDYPPSYIAAKFRSDTLFYLASTERYLLFLPQYPESEIRSGALAKEKSQIVYIHDRRANRWFTVPLEGTTSRTRIFGSWLASIVEYWNPNHGQNPGIENERNYETKVLPNIRELYPLFAARVSFIPGDLELLNLNTHRRIFIHTGQEDSEILWVGDDQVLYRVNDAIYQAQIAGDKVHNPMLVVQDDDVPEIHWVFWSK